MKVLAGFGHSARPAGIGRCLWSRSDPGPDRGTPRDDRGRLQEYFWAVRDERNSSTYL